MSETKQQLIDVEQKISAALSDGSHINEDQLMRLTDAFTRNNYKSWGERESPIFRRFVQFFLAYNCVRS